MSIASRHLFPNEITAAWNLGMDELSSLAKAFTKRISCENSWFVTSDDESIKNTKL